MKRNLYVGRVLCALVPFLTISSEVQATLAKGNTTKGGFTGTFAAD